MSAWAFLEVRRLHRLSVPAYALPSSATNRISRSKSDPDWRFQHRTAHLFGNTFNYFPQPYHTNTADFRAARQFHGVGPSLSWDASMPFAGNQQHGELAFDWGVNGAALFGRQKARTQHQTTSLYHSGATILTMVFEHEHGGICCRLSQSPPASIVREP